MPYEIAATRSFSASHQLRLYDGSMESLHGHNWQVTVTVGAEQLDSIGVVMDFHELQRRLDAVTGPMHNRHLNELEAFKTRNPSAENVAVVIAQSLKLPAGMSLLSVQVWETPDCSAIFRPR
ncbi:MAG: 6-carboxytetrahydropterin synthase [Phycisphaerales bacterium]|nr:6-carboxytetrahydropterin synthase [Phycisphaerales bacterium]